MMKFSRNCIVLTTIFAVCLFAGCSSPTATSDTAESVDVVPQIGSNLAVKTVVNWGGLSSDAFTNAKTQLQLFSCSPILTGVSKNTADLKIGDSFSSSVLGMTVTTTISKDSSGNIVFSGTMDDGSYKMVYYPTTKSFDFEQGFFFEESSGALASNNTVTSGGTPTYAYVHCKMSGIKLSDEGYYHAPMSVALVESFGSTGYMLYSPSTYAECYYGKDGSGNLISASYLKGGRISSTDVPQPSATNQATMLADCEALTGDITTGSSYPFLFILTHGTTDTIGAYAPWDGSNPALPFSSIL